MKKASRSIDLISKTRKIFTCRTVFFLITPKNFCTCSTLFCLSFPWFCTTTTSFGTTKTSNVLVTHYFYGGIVVCAYQRFCFLCSCSLLFFHCRSFSPGRQHFSFSHRRYGIFMFFFQRNSSPLFSITRSSSFSVIHVSVNIKNNVEKGSTLLFFFSLKVRAAMRFSSVAVGCHICRLSYFALHLVRLLTSSFYFALFSSLICVVRDCAHTVGGSS